MIKYKMDSMSKWFDLAPKALPQSPTFIDYKIMINGKIFSKVDDEYKTALDQVRMWEKLKND